MSLTPEAWLEEGFALAWPESIPRADYARAISLVVNMGGALRGLQRGAPAARRSDGSYRKTYGTRRADAKAIEEIEQLLREGKWTVSELAQKIGLRWAESVPNILRRLGAREVTGLAPTKRGRRWTLQESKPAETPKNSKYSDKATRILELLRSPSRYADIAKTLGVSFEYVNRIARRHNAQPAGRHQWVIPKANGKPAPVGRE